MRVIGVLSGTSHDAVDAAAAELVPDGRTLLLTPLGRIGSGYPADLRDELAAALPPAATTMRQVCALDTRIGQAFAAVADRANRELCGGRADLVVSHGQTVYHWVQDGLVRGTLQLGQPAWIAERTGCPVVSDLRARDVAAGGQGAPLVGLVDLLWLRGRPGVPVALNLGGIANVTVPRGPAGPSAFDTGPANALIDAAVTHLTGGRLDHDRDGRIAAAGVVHPVLLRRLLDEPYYALSPPKTTGKELFNGAYLRAALEGLGPLAGRDVVATVTELTARTVAEAVRSHGATEVIASGGGVRNPTLMARLRAALGEVPLRVSDDLGLPAADKEAHAFAVLGWLTLHGLAGTEPGCTGARGPSVLGSITPGRHRLRLPPPVPVPERLAFVAPPSGAPPSGAQHR
ncbi:anhydro-N-acetylmuramic acid kinase [Wenjunlia vitaminophila]|uniref:Anhydro-N-acetylmuramic acid kinase n=1 Tax=Wenjunlia vitaminophila TaxID=76728 RepID=A0A0T6LWQ2_WENVI|nr:anhydro-N-acetylmuramic acid kinase [Wenjunlia vitaminophila]KRV50583.1 anhydro-N-acetylmuramic acid kinase [Wenjunlia vitaminophila]